jgi:hypothetical protein
VKLNKAQQDEEDIAFIIDEIVRFASMEVRELMAYLREHKNDVWFTLPHPTKEGQITIGQAAAVRFYDMAKRHLSTQSELNNNFDTEDFTKAVEKEFVRVFLKNEEKEINQRVTDKMLSAAVKQAKKDHKTLKHFIPCVIVSSKEPEIFRVGPATFIRIEKFLADYKNIFDTERARIKEEHIQRCQETIKRGRPKEKIATPDISEGIANLLVGNTIKYFENFKWMAIVEIPECNVKISRQRAERTIEAVLDILKLFFGRTHGEGLRQGHTLGVPLDTADLTQDSDGKFNFVVRSSSQDTPTGKEWFRVLIEPDASYFEAAISALSSCVDPQYTSHLKERFLDAMAWYGQAISEKQISVQIVKYVAALERLTVTKKLEKGLTETVVRRTAILSYDGTKEGYEKAEKEAAKIYDYRSGLMHGSISPFDKELEFISPMAERITRRSLFDALRIFTELDNKVENVREKQLEAKYLELENQIEELLKSNAKAEE